MRELQWFLVSAIICVSVKYSFAVQELFGDCAVNADCPDSATCVTVGTNKKCRCDNGYYALDLPVFSDGESVTVCRNLGICSPFDNLETDCGTNGDCVLYEDAYGVTTAFCKCQPGYTGINCNRQGVLSTPYTTRSPYLTTRRPGNIGSLLPIIGGGALLLLLLAGGGAALASTSG